MKKNILRENRNLKHQLEVAQDELQSIKNSRAFSTIRTLGEVKRQIRKSPTGFAKKAAKKIVSTKGGRLKSWQYVSSNLATASVLQDEYKEWIVLNEPDETELRNQSKVSTQLVKKPLISIITPVFNPPVDVLEDLIKTVQNQTYPYFELCLGNFGDDQEVKSLIAKYAKNDSRIKDWSFDENKGIAANSNQILAKATGEYIALLDHDDTLSPDALYENVRLLNQEDYDFIYSDKDKIDEAGNRFEPFFKPDWSPEIMLSANYLTHLNVMKTEIVRNVGGWSSDTDGAQDWDVFLKVISASKLIAHIPKVLYHWRVISTSTAMSIETKPYALLGQRVTVDRYLEKHSVEKVKSYHEGAELLLDWPKQANYTLVTAASSLTSLYALNAKAHQADSQLTFVIFHNFDLPNDIHDSRRVTFIKYESESFAETVRQHFSTRANDTIIWFTEDINSSKLSTEQIDDLAGWLEVGGVQAAGPRVVTGDSKIAMDCGAILTSEGLRPLFWQSPPYHQTPIGNIEWIRNLLLVSSHIISVKSHSFSHAIAKLGMDPADKLFLPAVQLELSKTGRLVFNPKVYVELNPGVEFDGPIYYDQVSHALIDMLPPYDGYGNPNLSPADPMHLVKVLQDADDKEDDDATLPAGYQVEALAHALNNVLDKSELEKNLADIRIGNAVSLGSKKSLDVLFILPGFEGIYAGLNNIFTFAERLQTAGNSIRFALIVEPKQLEEHRKRLAEKFPNLAENAGFLTTGVAQADQLPASDIAICTQWATAYVLAKYHDTKRKCYFIQDKEASFYAQGTISALVSNTYKFGFFGLANTPGLLDWYKKEYQGEGVVIKSTVDLSTYTPDEVEKNISVKPYKVFFYARPNEPRNAFELGVAALIKLKKKLGKDVEIYAAGASWEPNEYGLQGVVTNLGKISYAKLPSFYRSMDVGLMFMFSGHPGVVASELMASGCPVVVNEYDDATWRDLYQHETTCLVSMPTANEVARNLERALIDHELRRKVIPGGIAKVKTFYANYDSAFTEAVEILKQPIK